MTCMVRIYGKIFYNHDILNSGQVEKTLKY